jgi:hypothetical protein
MIGATAAKLGLGLLLGLAFGWGHLYLLRRALSAALDSGPTSARKQIVRGLPIRVALWAPAAMLAAYAGLPACVGLLLGMGASRWLYWRNVVLPS